MLHSIGIVAAKKKDVLVKLTSTALPEYTAGDYYGYTLRFFSDGTFSVSAFNTPVADEWYTLRPQTGIGSDYSVRFTMQAGNQPNYRASNAGVWVGISGSRLYTWEEEGAPPNGGRVLIEIRDNTTSTIQASAQFWTPGYAP